MPAAIEPEAFAEYRALLQRSGGDPRRAARTIAPPPPSTSSTTGPTSTRRSPAPCYLLWGARGLVGQMYDVLAVWRERASNVSGKALPCGHWVAEEVPNETLEELKAFLAG